MQDMRKLTAERSTMNTYVRDETIEVPGHSIALLLEGYIKSHSLVGDLIASPAVLWPAKGNSSFLSQDGSGYKSTSFSYQGSSYHVETRARVVLFDMAAFYADITVQSRKSSLLLHDQSSRSVGREYSGLLSWPEHYFKSQEHQGDAEETDNNRNNLSTTAMQLSIYGSQKHDLRVLSKWILQS